MKQRLHDWGNTALAYLLFPLVLLASFLVTWVFSDYFDEQGDD